MYKAVDEDLRDFLLDLKRVIEDLPDPGDVMTESHDAKLITMLAGIMGRL